MKRIFKMIICLFITLLALNNSYAMGQWSIIEPRIETAVDFTLFDLDGNKYTLSDFMGNNQIILFFWATWCPNCRDRIEPLNNLVEKLKDKNVVIWGIDTGETSMKVEAFLKKNPVSFKVLLDIDTEVSVNSYNVLGVPTFIIIGKDGKIKFQDHYLPDNIEEILF